MILWVHHRNGEGGKGLGFLFNPACMAYTSKFGTANNTFVHRLDGGAMVIWESEAQLYQMIEKRMAEANPA